GFTGMLFKLFSEFYPHYVIVAIDAPGKTFRDDLYGQYQQLRQEAQAALSPEEKGEVVILPPWVVTPEDERRAQYNGTRDASPDALMPQVRRILEVIEGFGIPIVGQTGLEADDVIATIVQRILDDPMQEDVQIRIVSKDKDLEQLIGDRVSLFDIHTDTLID